MGGGVGVGADSGGWSAPTGEHIQRVSSRVAPAAHASRLTRLLLPLSQTKTPALSVFVWEVS